MKRLPLLLLGLVALDIWLAYMSTAYARDLQQGLGPTDPAPTPSATPDLTATATNVLPFATPYITISISSNALHTGERFTVTSYTNVGMADVVYSIEPTGLVTYSWKPCGWYQQFQCATNDWLALAPGTVSVSAGTGWGEVCCWYWSAATLAEPVTLTVTGPEITLTPTSTPTPSPTSTPTPSPTPTASPTVAATPYLTLSTSSYGVALGHVFTIEAHTDLGLASVGYSIQPSQIITFDSPDQFLCEGGEGRTNCQVVRLRPLLPGIASISAGAYGETCCWYFTGARMHEPITITITGTQTWYPLILR